MKIDVMYEGAGVGGEPRQTDEGTRTFVSSVALSQPSAPAGFLPCRKEKRTPPAQRVRKGRETSAASAIGAAMAVDAVCRSAAGQIADRVPKPREEVMAAPDATRRDATSETGRPPAPPDAQRQQQPRAQGRGSGVYSACDA